MNRIVTVTENGLDYEANPRQAEILMKDRGMDEGGKKAATPGKSAQRLARYLKDKRVHLNATGA